MLIKKLKLFIVNLLVVFALLSCTVDDSFEISGVLHGSYKGYLYLNYDQFRDSILVQNGKFYFKGKIPNEIVYSAYFSTDGVSAMNKIFFLENNKILIDVSVEKKTINSTVIDWFIINEVTGTTTSLLEKDYENFKKQHQNETDWRIKNFQKIDEFATKHPSNQYVGELLNAVSSDSIIDTIALRRTYIKLDSTSQDPDLMMRIKRRLYPSLSRLIGKPMHDFKLKNENGRTIKSSDYSGQVLLIDFWATWCKPCISQFPEMKRIYQKHKHKNFKIISISIDRNKEIWENFLQEEESIWINLWDSNIYPSIIQKSYDVSVIPSTYLINEEGIIIAHNIELEKLDSYLQKNLK